MRIIQRGRGAGKTTEIISAWRAHKGDSRFVVPTTIERDRIIRQYQLTPDEQRRVIVAGQDRLKGHHGEVFADNIDWLLSMFLGEAVDVGTVNGNPASEAGEATPPPQTPQVQALLTALKRVTEHMDRAGGDNCGMPECPWCRYQDGDEHAPECELMLARQVIADVENGVGAASVESTPAQGPRKESK